MGKLQNLKNIGEFIRLEKAWREAVEKLSAKGLLDKDRININYKL
jgi:hypothetical protein